MRTSPQISAIHVELQAVLDLTNGRTRRRLGLNQREFAFVTQCAERSISGWENGAPISASARKQLLELQALQRELGETLESGTVGAWLRSANDGFGGERPLDVIARGQSHRIWQLLFWIQSGTAS